MPQLSFDPPQRTRLQQQLLDVYDPPAEPKLSLEPPKQAAPKMSFDAPKPEAPKLSFTAPKLSFEPPKEGTLDKVKRLGTQLEGDVIGTNQQMVEGGIKKILGKEPTTVPDVRGAYAMSKLGDASRYKPDAPEKKLPYPVSAAIGAGEVASAAPVAAVHGLVGKPLERNTGIPAELTDAALTMFAPGAKGKPAEVAGAAKTVAEAPKPAAPPPEAGPATSFKSRIFSPDEPVASTQGAASPKGMHDVLTQHQQAAQLDMKELGNFIKPLRGAVPEATWEKFLDHADDPKGVPLAPEEKVLFDNTIGKMREEIEAKRKEITGSGIKLSDVTEEGEGSLGGAIRVSKQHDTPLGKMLGEDKKQPVSGRSVSKQAGTLQGRSMMNLTVDGKRTPVHVTGDGEVVNAKTRQSLGTYDPETDRVRMAGGKDAKLTEATRKEIEAATDGKVSYHKNALGVYATTLLNVRRAARSVKLMEAIKASPEFKDVARGPQAKGPTPYEVKGGRKNYWREVQGVPGMKGYKFAPRIAEELEDFVHGHNVSMGELGMLDKLNKFELNLFFFMQPFHGYNLTEMALVTRAGEGGAKGFARDFGEAAKDVMLSRKPYVKAARAGVPMPGLSNAGEQFRKITLDAMGVQVRRNPTAFRAIFKELLGDEAANMQPAQMFNFFGDASKQAIQSYQDILQMALMKGAERGGLDMARARERIAKTFPSDSPQSRVLGSRLLGQTLQTQAFLQFPHYFYNRIKGMGNILKDLKGPERVRAAKQLAAVIIGYEMGKQVYTPMLQYLTGNPNAQSGGFGYDVFPEALERLKAGMTGGDYGRTIGQTAQTLASPGYAVQALDLARGVQPYFGKPLSVLGEGPGDIGKDYASQFAYHLSPVQRAFAIQHGRMKPSDLAYQQLLGTKFPANPEHMRSTYRNLRTRERYGTAADDMLKDLSAFVGRQ